MVSLPVIKRWVAVAVVATTIAAAAHALGPRNHVKRDTRAEVEKVDQQWRQAELSNDTAAMDKLLSDDYLGVTAGGRVVTKSQQLERMRTRQSDIKKLDFSDVKVRLVGTGAAIVTSLAELDGNIDGKPIHGQFRSIRVYQHGPAGTWKIINFEATTLRPDVAASARAGSGR